jgi:putative radical SAM enzyme (TIGR03279 family)
MLADANISLCCQIVLCKGYNDGEELDRSLHDLIALYPALTSVAIVPAGLTRFRDGLCHLERFTPEECAAVIKQINAYGNWCKKEYGTRLIYPSDEFYITAGLPIPEEDFYEDYSQIENGVGLLRDLQSSVEFELEDLSPYADFCGPRSVSVATGYAAYEHILSIAKKLESAFEGLRINVYRIKNDFFGDSITVSGLLTGKDLCAQLKDRELGEELLFSASALRADGEVFLDDMTPDELSAALGVPVRAVESDGYSFISAALGLN